MSTQSTQLSAQDREYLALYIRAAERVADRVRPWARFQWSIPIGGSHAPTQIPDNDFLALLTAFRLVYAKKEPTYFLRIANILYRLRHPELIRYVPQCREGWHRSLDNRIFLQINDELAFHPQRVLDTWINGEVFHQVPELVRDVDRLREIGPMAIVSLQLTVRDLSFVIHALGNACALVLNRPLIPLIIDADDFPSASDTAS